MNIYQIILIIIFAVMSVVGFLSMMIDKSRAKRKAWRIKESVLFLFAFLLGGVGSLIGMYTFRHKTQHWYFIVGMPILAIFSLAVFILGLYFLGTKAV